MSAFDRNPLKAEYEAAGRAMGSRTLAFKAVPLSPQNRRVRYAVDLMKAREKGNTCREPTPRQVRRHVARLGLSSFIPNQPPVGPDEV